MDQIILKLPELIASVASAGIPGLIGAGILLVVFVWGMIQYNRIKKREQHKREEIGRNRDQADNAPQNSTADQDAANSESKGEDILNGD